LLDDVLAGYLATLTERELDAAFASLLQAAGYWDVHLTHGSTEFGKDFIAKGLEGDQVCQFMFQTKVGDIGMSDWRGVRAQIDEMRWNPLSHPRFDATLPRRPRLVTTGRLVGNAALDAQQYREVVEARGETAFDVWQGEELVRMFSDAPNTGLAHEPVGPLFGILAAIEEGTLTEADLEAFTRRWVTAATDGKLWRAALTAAIVAHQLFLADRLDLAILVGCHLIRATWASRHGGDPVSQVAVAVAQAGRGLVLRYGGLLVDGAERFNRTPIETFHAADEVAAPVTYPVRCLRLVELVGLFGLATDDAHRAAKAAEVCRRVIVDQPGASHPVSDHWAVSLVAPAILLQRFHPEVVPRWLLDVAAWVADHYEHPEPGLAPAWSSARTEIEYLLGSALEHVDVARYQFSFCATVVLDLLAAFEYGDVYDDAVNDFLAVEICPFVVEADDTVAQYIFDDDQGGLHVEVNAQYLDEWAGAEGWKAAPHHHRSVAMYLSNIGRPWDLLAVCSVVRDRHFPVLARELGTAG